MKTTSEPPSRNITGMIVRGAVLALACIAIFDLPAAFLVSRGWSPWVALAAGLATFPLAPLVWHALSERKRRQNPPPKPLTRGWERLLMRSAFVGVLVIGGMILVAGGSAVWRATRHHAFWFIPDGSEPLTADSRVLDVVPPDAQAVVWVRMTDETRTQLVAALPGIEALSKALSVTDFAIAIGPSGILLAEQGDSELVDFAADMLKGLEDVSKQYGGPDAGIPQPTRSKTPSGVRYMVSSEWAKSLSTGRPKLFELIPRAPDNAFVVAVAQRPEGKKLNDLPEGATAAVGYVRVHRGYLEAVGEVDFETDKLANTVAAQARKASGEIFEGRCIEDAGLRVDVSTRSSTLHARISIALDEIRPLVECLEKRAKK